MIFCPSVWICDKDMHDIMRNYAQYDYNMDILLGVDGA